MDYSPINFRRLDWFYYEPAEKYEWSELRYLDSSQSALTREAYRGDLPKTDYSESRSYLSYFLE